MYTIRALFPTSGLIFLIFRKGQWSFQPMDILGNLRVRLSDPQEKGTPKKFFGLKHSKNNHSRGGEGVRLEVPLFSSKCVLLLRKNAVSFPELAFYFPEVLFCFLELLFCFPKVPYFFPEVPFYFSKTLYCFPKLDFSFPEVPSFYLLWASFSISAFYSADLTFSSCSEIFPSLLFPLETP